MANTWCLPSFEKKESAIETIIPMQEEHGKWKVMTYRIR